MGNLTGGIPGDAPIAERRFDGKTIKKQFIRPFRFIEGGEKKVIYFDHSLPGAGEVDQIDIGFWRGPGNNTMVIDELEVEMFAEE